jgi:hypothetical protein
MVSVAVGFNESLLWDSLKKYAVWEEHRFTRAWAGE